jgi:hypothetical protein
MPAPSSLRSTSASGVGPVGIVVACAVVRPSFPRGACGICKNYVSN